MLKRLGDNVAKNSQREMASDMKKYLNSNIKRKINGIGGSSSVGRAVWLATETGRGFDSLSVSTRSSTSGRRVRMYTEKVTWVHHWTDKTFSFKTTRNQKFSIYKRRVCYDWIACRRRRRQTIT